MTAENSIETSLALAYDMAFNGMSAEQIEEHISQRHPNEEELMWIMRRVEDYVVNARLAMQARDRVRGRFIGGLGICLIGALISLYTALSWHDEFILAYGAILFGAWYAWKNFRLLRRPLEEFVPQERRMGKKFRRHA